MAHIFGGMLIGFMLMMIFMGGSAALQQAFASIQQWYLMQVSIMNPTTTWLLLGLVSFLGGALWIWPSKPALASQHLIRGLRRHVG